MKNVAPAIVFCPTVHLCRVRGEVSVFLFTIRLGFCVRVSLLFAFAFHDSRATADIHTLSLSYCLACWGDSGYIFVSLLSRHRPCIAFRCELLTIPRNSTLQSLSHPLFLYVCIHGLYFIVTRIVNSCDAFFSSAK